MQSRGHGTVGIVVVLVLAATAGAGAGQNTGDAPPWADAVEAQLADAADEYNTEYAGETGHIEQWLLSDARVNLHVTDATGSTAVYTVRFEDDHRVRAVRQGRYHEPTLRVHTTRDIIDEVARAPDVEAAVRTGIRTQRIHVERVVHVGGVSVGIGPADLVVGVGSLALVLIATTKFGLESLVAALLRVLDTATAALGTVWQYATSLELGGVAALITILDKFKRLDPVRRLVTLLRDKLDDAVATLGGSEDQAGTENESDAN